MALYLTGGVLPCVEVEVETPYVYHYIWFYFRWIVLFVVTCFAARTPVWDWRRWGLCFIPIGKLLCVGCVRCPRRLPLLLLILKYLVLFCRLSGMIPRLPHNLFCSKFIPNALSTDSNNILIPPMKLLHTLFKYPNGAISIILLD